MLDDVLDHIRSVSRLAAIFTVATRPAVKILADGRNAHLIQQPLEWWLPKFWTRWELQSFQRNGAEFVLFGTVPSAGRPRA
jgi:hypothetical protein